MHSEGSEGVEERAGCLQGVGSPSLEGMGHQYNRRQDPSQDVAVPFFRGWWMNVR